MADQVARCEMDSDFLAKASSHMEKALRQDYGGKPTPTPPPSPGKIRTKR
ncbi:unnamed protein product [Laminaria digitata]